MILINLLPHREAARKRRKQQFVVTAVLSAFFGAATCLAGYSWLQGQLENQKNRNLYLKDSTAKLDAQIKDIAGLQADILALKARQTAVEDLQADRNAPVNLMNELVDQTPDGIYIVSMKQEGRSIVISGVAQSQERVSELLRNLSTNSEWLEKPELVEIVATVQALTSKDQRTVYSFTLKAGLVRGVDEKILNTVPVVKIENENKK